MYPLIRTLVHPFGFTDVDIDQMIAKKDLVMVKPPKDTHKSDVWEAGLRLVCFPNSDAKTDWHRCMWCGHNWCLEKGKGTGNMRTHVFRHFTTPFQKIYCSKLIFSILRFLNFIFPHKTNVLWPKNGQNWSTF